MSENTTELQSNPQKKIHPSSERIKHLRHQINERKESVRRIFRKSGSEPTQRELINLAGDNLRWEMESDYDIVTGILNRNGFEKQKKLAIQRSIEQNLPTAIASIDLDDLKITNDTLGHTAGDAYLKNAAGALSVASRATDITGRVGGDEFQVLLINTTPDLANAWKERVEKEMKEREVRASIGIASVDLDNIQESIDKADKIMYEEKRNKKTGLN
jgi:diguanylate cyclase (GGDEF)-like protein